MILYRGLTVTVGGWRAGFEMNFSKWYIGLPKTPLIPLPASCPSVFINGHIFYRYLCSASPSSHWSIRLQSTSSIISFGKGGRRAIVVRSCKRHRLVFCRSKNNIRVASLSSCLAPCLVSWNLNKKVSLRATYIPWQSSCIPSPIKCSSGYAKDMLCRWSRSEGMKQPKKAWVVLGEGIPNYY